MTVNKITSGAGLRGCRVWLLDSTGYPHDDETASAGYDGIDVTGIQSIAINTPEVRRIPHRGNDRVFAQDHLPATELPSGTITTGKSNQELDAKMTSTLVETVGDANMDIAITNEQGNEADVMLVYWRQALDTDPASGSAFGARRWQTIVNPKARLVPQLGGADQDAADENAYAFTPTIVTTTPWGVALSNANNGATEAGRLRFTAEYPIMFEAFLGNNTAGSFVVTKTPISATKTVAFDDGVAATVSSVTVATKTVYLNDTPGNASKIVIMYETTDSIG